MRNVSINDCIEGTRKAIIAACGSNDSGEPSVRVSPGMYFVDGMAADFWVGRNIGPHSINHLPKMRVFTVLLEDMKSAEYLKRFGEAVQRAIFN